MGIVRGFKDFVLRGNVVDLAVGVVIGAAFTSVVNQFGASFLEPLIKRVSGGQEFAGRQSIGDGQYLEWAAFLNAVVSFLIAAATVYFLVVLPINKLHERMARGREPKPKAPSEEVRLLTEIRDALIEARGARGGAEPGGRTDPRGLGGLTD